MTETSVFVFLLVVAAASKEYWVGEWGPCHRDCTAEEGNRKATVRFETQEGVVIDRCDLNDNTQHCDDRYGGVYRGKWTEWHALTRCEVKGRRVCGAGEERLRRYCRATAGFRCADPRDEKNESIRPCTVYCGAQDVEGVWEAWSSWQCEQKSSGVIERTRKRNWCVWTYALKNESPQHLSQHGCVVDEREKEEQSERTSYEHCVKHWSDWSPWSECTNGCGQRVRKRICIGIGAECDTRKDGAEQKLECSDEVYQQIHCKGSITRENVSVERTESAAGRGRGNDKAGDADRRTLVDTVMRTLVRSVYPTLSSRAYVFDKVAGNMAVRFNCRSNATDVALRLAQRLNQTPLAFSFSKDTPYAWFDPRRMRVADLELHVQRLASWKTTTLTDDGVYACNLHVSHNQSLLMALFTLNFDQRNAPLLIAPEGGQVIVPCRVQPFVRVFRHLANSIKLNVRVNYTLLHTVDLLNASEQAQVTLQPLVSHKHRGVCECELRVGLEQGELSWIVSRVNLQIVQSEPSESWFSLLQDQDSVLLKITAVEFTLLAVFLLLKSCRQHFAALD